MPLFGPKTEADKIIAGSTEAIRSNPNDIEARKKRACAYASKRHWDRAIEDFSWVYRHLDSLWEAAVNRGNEAGREDARRWRQEKYDIRVLWAAACYLGGDRYRAADMLKEAIRFSPDNAFAWLLFHCINYGGLSPLSDSKELAMVKDTRPEVLDWANSIPLLGDRKTLAVAMLLFLSGMEGREALDCGVSVKIDWTSLQ